MQDFSVVPYLSVYDFGVSERMVRRLRLSESALTAYINHLDLFREDYRRAWRSRKALLPESIPPEMIAIYMPYSKDKYELATIVFRAGNYAVVKPEKWRSIGFNVTHVPTGMQISGSGKKGEMISLAKRLHQDAPDALTDAPFGDSAWIVQHGSVGTRQIADVVNAFRQEQ